MDYHKQKELELKIRDLITRYVLETTTLRELEYLAGDLMRTVRKWNESIKSRCEFCYGVENCESDHK